MNVLDGMEFEEIICVGLEYGDDFHECIEEVARNKDIQSGVILSAVGTFYEARIHYITHCEFPGDDKFVEMEGPVELCGVSGIIADYRPHMHCTMAARGEEMFVGHLEPGCKILYLGEVVIGKLAGRRLAREEHPEYGTPRLIDKDEAGAR